MRFWKFHTRKRLRRRDENWIGVLGTTNFGFERLEERRLLASDSIWQLATTDNVARGSSLTSYLRTTDFESYTLDSTRLVSALSKVPSEVVAGKVPLETTEFALADPDGKLQRFSIFDSSIMAPELQAQFPQIKTYAGQGIDDPAATVRFDVGPNGFHAQVLSPNSPNGRWYIDPYYHLNTSLYASYYASSLTRSATPQKPLDDVAARKVSTNNSLESASAGTNTLSKESLVATSPSSATPQARSGTQLRTYRTAVAATGEYTAFFGGTVANGQAAIVTAINRVSGIYENELSIRLQLVANNNLLVYTNATTDPYTNGDAGLLLDQNQLNVDNVIGSSNYDLGHVFSTGGGGLAGLGVVGVNGQKAQGETGAPSPVGDAFYVDYVAHEIGHQFGGNHTFNGDSGSCSGANRNGSTAYEPGSGSTIQAYAGICGNDDLQANSDAYFHSVSFDEMIAYVDGSIPGVGVRTNTGNAIPTINAGPDYSIPTGTPFTLTAVGNDANGNTSLTYNWEQRDLGPQADINAADNGSIPLFRSFSPTSNPSRTFPRLTDIVNNTTTIGEKLPTVARAMDFRATVRDNRPGGGAVNTDDVVVNVVNTGAPFRVTAPNTAVSWAGLSTQTVTWDVAGTNVNGINTANVRILLSTDGGLTYPTVIAASEANDGSATITVPNSVTSTARVRVEAVGNIFFDISNTNFSITTPVVIAFPQNFDSVTVPNLPTGWTQSTTSTNAWATVGSGSDTAPNSAFVANPAAVSDSILTAPVFTVTANTSRLSFRNSYNTEAGIDGGVLEISVNGGSFTDIISAGGSFVSGGYVSALTAAGNPLNGRNAWHGNSSGFVTSVVNLPASALNQNAVLRWRFGSNASNAGVGWRIDTITFVDTVAPSTLSFNRKTPSTSTTNADTLVFLATFSEPVIGVDATDFAVTGTTGTISVAQVTTNTYDVTISGGNLANLNGAVGLNFSASPTITDLALNPLPSTEPPIDETFLVDNTPAFPQNFDSVTVPNLPTGWSQSTTASNAWTVVSSGSDSLPNSAFVTHSTTVSDSILTAPSFVVTPATSRLSFRNSYNTENTFDGGVLEISVNGGAFTDIVTAGGSFLSGGYVGTIDSGFSNPLAGRNAWTGNSLGFITTTFNLPSSAMNQPVVLRWRSGTDSSDTAVGWRIDTITFVDTTPPSTTSFTRSSPTASPTNADTLVFLATFSEPVTGVSAADFVVTGTTGTLVVAQITTSTYSVTVSGGNLASLNGTVGLNFAASPTITDLALNALPSTEPTIDQTFVVDNASPTVTSIIAAGSAWLPAFIDGVDGGGAGAGNGLGIVLTPNATIPNIGIDRIYVQFSEPVVGFSASRVALFGIVIADYASVSTVSYDSTNRRGLIQLSSPLTREKLRIGVSASLTDTALNGFDGDSDGSAGGVLDFRFNVLIGDANRDGSNDVADVPSFRTAFNSSVGNPRYNSLSDWNSDGNVDAADFPVFRSNFNRSLPSGDPGALSFQIPRARTIALRRIDAYFSQLDLESEQIRLRPNRFVVRARG